MADAIEEMTNLMKIMIQNNTNQTKETKDQKRERKIEEAREIAIALESNFKEPLSTEATGFF